MSLRIPVRPALVDWALERSGLERDAIAARIPGFSEWSIESPPTLRQIERFAATTHVPLGALFMEAPPLEQLPIADFRTLGNRSTSRPSGDLLDTIYICQMRQEWYRGFALSRGEDKLPFVGSASKGSDPDLVATEIRSALGFGIDGRRGSGTWEDALTALTGAIEGLGVLVMVSGVVGSNNRRTLDPEEFRGFALSDEHAPLIFVNGADSKSAQMFTLIHELAHIWLGESAVSDVPVTIESENSSELWCNAVAAEVLVPLANLLSTYRGDPSTDEFQRLQRIFKVSTLVVIKRLFDGGQFAWNEFRTIYESELARVLAIVKQRQASGGGNYYNTQPRRLSPQFVRAVAIDTLEGRTLYREAYELLGVRKHETFLRLAERVGVPT